MRRFVILVLVVAFGLAILSTPVSARRYDPSKPPPGPVHIVKMLKGDESGWCEVDAVGPLRLKNGIGSCFALWLAPFFGEVIISWIKETASTSDEDRSTDTEGVTAGSGSCL